MKKRFLLTLLSFIMAFSASAQEHLTFRGIEIDGPLPAFVQHLNKLGYVVIEERENDCLLKGVFSGVDDCVIYVLTTPNSHIVCQVAVFLPATDSWAVLKSSYLEYRDLLISKYGTPSVDRKSFISPYYEGDGYEMQALSNDKCKYLIRIHADLGNVSLMINSKDYKRGNLLISYEDAQNAEIKEQEQQKQKMSDL